MSFGLLAPAALATLAALLVPLLLHLARRDATRPTPFSALRWLRERPKPQRRLRVDDWPLLLVRLLLLALLALWLAWPVLRGEPAPARWTVVVPGVAPDAIPTADAGVEARWLAPGFPLVDGSPAPEPQTAGVSSLLRELDMIAPPGTALTVVVPEIVAGADGGRVSLSRPVDWQVVAVRTSDVDEAPSAPRIDVVGLVDDAPAARVFQALAQAWRPDDADALRQMDTAAASRADAVIAWWAQAAPPADWLAARTGRVVLLGSDASQQEQAWETVPNDAAFEHAACGAARCLRVVGPFDPARNPTLLEPDFPARLQALLRPLPAPSRVAAVDLAPDVVAATYPVVPRDLRPWWALLVALVFALERWMAASPRRTRSA